MRLHWVGVLIKVFSRSLVGVLTVCLLGCGCLVPFTPNSPNLYADVYEAERLQYTGEYKAAIDQYERAAKKFRRLSVDTKVIHVSFPTFFNYGIAFCYTQLAEAKGDVALYIKAEEAIRESYQTAIVASDKADVLYLWGYILYKQEHYEEARAKFKEQIEISAENESGSHFLEDALFGLGKAYMELGDAPAAQRTFAQLLERIEGDSDFYTTQVLFGLGKVYLELGDKPATQRVFAQLLEHIEIELQDSFVAFDAKIFYEQALYALGKAYLELGDAAAAQRAYAQLLEHFPDSSYTAEVERLLENP